MMRQVRQSRLIKRSEDVVYLADSQVNEQPSSGTPTQEIPADVIDLLRTYVDREDMIA